MKSVFIQILLVVGFFMLVNVVLHFGQEVWHSGTDTKIESIEIKLTALEGKIKYYEQKNEGQGLSSNEYTAYDSLIETYNIHVEEINELYQKTGTRYYIRGGSRGARSR
jgi:hypothetical protein